MRTWIFLAAVLAASACGKSEPGKAQEATSAPKPAEPTSEEKQACADTKQKASAAWKGYVEAAKQIADFQQTDQAPDAKKDLEKAKKEKPYSKDKMFVDELKAKVDAMGAYVEALDASTASYRSAAEIATATAQSVEGATRDAKAASDRAAAGARDARDAANKQVAAYFDPANDGPGQAVALMKRGYEYNPSEAAKAKVAEMEARIAQMTKQLLERHQEIYAVAEAATAASGKIEETCKGIP